MASKQNMEKHFLQLKLKLHYLKADIFFLKQCRQQKVFPNFIKVKCAIENSRTQEVVNFSKFKWLHLERKYLYSKLSTVELELYSLHLKVIKDLNGTEYDFWQKDILNPINERVIKMTKKKKNKLNKKFKKLMEGKRDISKSVFLKRTREVPEYIKNISSEQFDEREMKVLEKGLNFGLKRPSLNIPAIIVDVESAIKFLPNTDKENIRTLIKPTIISASYKMGASNASMKTIQNLRKKNVFYLKADKGNSMVIIDKLEYHKRMRSMVDTVSFTKITSNPLPKMIKEVSSLRKKICDTLNIPKWLLMVSNPRMPQLYGLPKIHKPGDKMRPIIASYDAPSYKIAKMLVKEFSALSKPPGKFIKNSYEFVDIISKIKLMEDDRLVSFDVESLYPSIPVPEALKILEEWLCNCNIPDARAEILYQAASLCMRQNYFQYENEYYRQTLGVNMGNPLSCFVANLFMGKIENDLEIEEKLPKIWLRYVDDIFAVVKSTEINNLFDMLNNRHPNIKFTLELENNGNLPFLDLMLSRGYNKIDIDIYRKPTNTSRYITFDSHCPFSTKLAAFHSMIYRLCRLPLNINNFSKELLNIKNIANINGYSESIIDRLVALHSKRIKFNSMTTLLQQSKFLDNINTKRAAFEFAPEIAYRLKSIFSKQNIQLVYSNKYQLKNVLDNGKAKEENIEKSGIYEISCNECEKIYIGQTKRKIKTRFKEHISQIKQNHPTSAVALHMVNENHLTTTIDNLKLKKIVNNNKKLDAWESILMTKYKTKLMNIDQPPLTSSLLSLAI